MEPCQTEENSDLMLIHLVQVYEVFVTSKLGRRGSSDIAKFYLLI